MQLDTITFEDFQVRTYSAGDGAPLLLLHGVGPGTWITANFSSVIDELARRWNIQLRPWKSVALVGVDSARGAVLVEPQTFMNRSGEAVGRVADDLDDFAAGTHNQ